MRIDQKSLIELQKKVHRTTCVRDITFLAGCPPFYAIFCCFFCLLRFYKGTNCARIWWREGGWHSLSPSVYLTSPSLVKVLGSMLTNLAKSNITTDLGDLKDIQLQLKIEPMICMLLQKLLFDFKPVAGFLLFSTSNSFDIDLIFFKFWGQFQFQLDTRCIDIFPDLCHHIQFMRRDNTGKGRIWSILQHCKKFQ